MPKLYVQRKNWLLRHIKIDFFKSIFLNLNIDFFEKSWKSWQSEILNLGAKNLGFCPKSWSWSWSERRSRRWSFLLAAEARNPADHRNTHSEKETQISARKLQCACDRSQTEFPFRGQPRSLAESKPAAFVLRLIGFARLGLHGRIIPDRVQPEQEILSG